jgi:hypothetical protein
MMERDWIKNVWIVCAGAMLVASCRTVDPANAARVAASPRDGARAEAVALLEQVARHLCEQDRGALEALLVTDDEYRKVVLPGSVRPGEPPAQMPAEKAEFFTRLHRTKSTYALAALLPACAVGGLTFKRAEVPDKLEQRAGYALIREPRLVFADAQGSEVVLDPGVVVYFDGKAKILSYHSD